jgi:hypothetical protein
MNNIQNLFDGVNTQTKICGICHAEKPIDCFGFDGGAKYRRYECKECAKAQNRLVTKLKKTAPSVPANYQCPICNRNKEEAQGYSIKKKTVWCADHDHKTGKFRSWLCHKCNLGLGNFADNQQRLQSAKQYLEIHERRH